MKKAARIIGCAVTLLLTAWLLFALTELTENKDSDNKYSDFFRDREYDVLFFGTSNVIDDVFPMELWKEYGIVSYNCGGTSNQLATTYWVMENALDYVTPKVVVIDCLHLSEDRKRAATPRLHYNLDAFPLSLTKIRAVLDLMDDPVAAAAAEAEGTENSSWTASRTELLWDYAVYHSRWNDLQKEDFSPQPGREKGARSLFNVSDGERIGNLCDGAILCVRGNATSKALVRESVHQLERSGCPLLGIVLNRVGDSKTGYYHKYYGDKYYGDNK